MKRFRQLAIFDIDGTLIDTRATDTDDCFFSVLRATTGRNGFGQDISAFAEPTSAGIFDEVIRGVHGRQPTSEEITLFQGRLDLAMRAAYIHGKRLPPTTGAINLLRSMVAGSNWYVAIATGNWHAEAVVKIESAGLPLQGIPMATASDRMIRCDILTFAVEYAANHYGVPSWDRTVYFGDGVWDVRAARACGIPFIGIADGERAARLRLEGASCILSDLGDTSAVEAALEQATVPERAK